MALKLYLSPRSPFARRVRLALNRLQIPFEEVFVDAHNPTEEFLKIQPIATIPVLELSDGTIIPDSNLILDYIHEESGGRIWSGGLQEKIASKMCEAMMTNSVNHFLETQKSTPDVDTLNEAKANIVRLIEVCSKIPSKTFLDERGLSQAGWDYAVACEYVQFRQPDLKIQIQTAIYEMALKNGLFSKSKPVA